MFVKEVEISLRLLLFCSTEHECGVGVDGEGEVSHIGTRASIFTEGREKLFGLLSLKVCPGSGVTESIIVEEDVLLVVGLER